MKILRDDLFRLLNHKSRPKSEMQLKEELVRFAGGIATRYSVHVRMSMTVSIFLENNGLIESDYEAVDLMYVKRSCWRKTEARKLEPRRVETNATSRPASSFRPESGLWNSLGST